MHDGALINDRIWRKLYVAKHSDEILDFGCGTGANILPFTALGFEMNGVDILEYALAMAAPRDGSQLPPTRESRTWMVSNRTPPHG